MNEHKSAAGEKLYPCEGCSSASFYSPGMCCHACLDGGWCAYVGNKGCLVRNHKRT